jgi:hypothetical protein
MMKQTRAAFVAFTMLLAGAPAFVATSGVAAARAAGSDHKAHKDHDRKHSDNERSHRKKHAVVCIKAPCPGDSGSQHRERKRHESDEARMKQKCGTLILPTAGCGTPVRDPVGNTRPTLPERTKQPLEDGRKPVLEN